MRKLREDNSREVIQSLRDRYNNLDTFVSATITQNDRGSYRDNDFKIAIQAKYVDFDENELQIADQHNHILINFDDCQYINENRGTYAFVFNDYIIEVEVK